MEYKRLNDAIVLATNFHSGQFRKVSGLPYILHPLAVMNQLLQLGVDQEDVLMAAVCHDILEDTSITPELLKTTIGDTAFSVVQDLTFTGGDKAAYIKGFQQKSATAILIKMIDRMYNTIDFYFGGDKKYAIKYLDKAKELFVDENYDKIEDIFGEQVRKGIETLVNVQRYLISNT